jgi:uncharacterized protein YlzI (FlbEa/FlbD family)
MENNQVIPATVQQHIGMWGMSHNLVEEDIELNETLPDTIKLGKKMLIKPAVYNKFKSLEQKIRNYLYSNSFSFPLVSQAHFVPKTKYMEVYNKLSEYKQEFMQMAQEFFDKYEEYKAEAIAYYKEFKSTANIDLESFYPNLEIIKKKFYIDIASFEISLPTSFSEIDLQTEISRQEAANQARQEAYAGYSQEYQQQMTLHMQKINDFTQEVVSTLRSNVIDHCSVALKKIGKKEVVSDSNIRTLLRHIDEFRKMNFLEDNSIEQELKKVEALLNSDRDFSKDKDAISLLQQHLSATVQEAKNLSDLDTTTGRYFRKISV